MNSQEGNNRIVVDVESSPDLGWLYGPQWEPKVVAYEAYSYLLGFSVKQLNGEQITRTLIDYKGYSRNKHSDKELVKDLVDIINHSEIVIGFNSNKFDIKKINTRIAFWDLEPLRPFRSVDIINTARGKMLLPSNRLDDVLKYFEIGMKLDHEKELMVNCARGDDESFKRLALYNAQDTLMTEKAYFKLLPWISNHPTLGMDDSQMHCPKCGSTHIKKDGFRSTQKGKFQTYKCLNCHSYSQGSSNLNTFIDENNKMITKRPLTSV